MKRASFRMGIAAVSLACILSSPRAAWAGWTISDAYVNNVPMGCGGYLYPEEGAENGEAGAEYEVNELPPRDTITAWAIVTVGGHTTPPTADDAAWAYITGDAYRHYVSNSSSDADIDVVVACSVVVAWNSYLGHEINFCWASVEGDGIDITANSSWPFDDDDTAFFTVFANTETTLGPYSFYVNTWVAEDGSSGSPAFSGDGSSIATIEFQNQ